MRRDVMVVIRSVGERTEALCRELFVRQVPESHVVVIREAPFVKAVARTFKIGLESGLQWTLAADADTLPTANLVDVLVGLAEAGPATVFKTQGDCLDRFMGGQVWGGPHLYRSSLLATALEVVPFDLHTTRPETVVLREMRKRGHETVQTEQLLCLHGYEQYHRDIYRQMFIKSHKHRPYVPYCLGLFQKMVPLQTDFKAAILGMVDGLACRGTVEVDVERFPADAVDRVLRAWGLEEKCPLVAAECMDLVESEIRRFVPLPEFEHMREEMRQRATSPQTPTSGRVGVARRLRGMIAQIWKGAKGR